MYFTVEEENLICLFDTNSRTAMISGIQAAMPDFGELEMREIAKSALKKLESMTDAKFAELDFCPTYYDDETEV